MPVHDWTRVEDGIFHAFHLAWLSELQKAMNAGLLPSGYYALAEQVAGSVGPDVLTLQGNGVAGEVSSGADSGSSGETFTLTMGSKLSADNEQVAVYQLRSNRHYFECSNEAELQKFFVKI